MWFVADECPNGRITQPHFPVDDAFVGATYQQRASIW